MKVNWYDRDSVVTYARHLGGGMTVFKHPDRTNYNITHTSRKDRYEPEWVIYQT